MFLWLCFCLPSYRSAADWHGWLLWTGKKHRFWREYWVSDLCWQRYRGGYPGYAPMRPRYHVSDPLGELWISSTGGVDTLNQVLGWTNVGLLLSQRLRRWPYFKPTLFLNLYTILVLKYKLWNDNFGLTLTTKALHLKNNVHPLKVVSRYRDGLATAIHSFSFKVGENYSYLGNSRWNNCKCLCLNTHFVSNNCDLIRSENGLKTTIVTHSNIP